MKKQIISIVLAVSMLATMFTAFMLPAVAADPVRNVKITDEIVKVDGVMEEIYLESSSIDSIYKIKDTANTKLAFKGYMVANYKGVYIWLEIMGEDTYVNTPGVNVHDFSGDNRDYLQVYYNMSASNTQTNHKGYIMHDYNNSTYFRNEAGSANSGYTKTAPAGFESAAVKTETGWISEMFIPWHSGTPVYESMQKKDTSCYFSIGFQYNDDYDGVGGKDGKGQYDCAVYDKETTSYWSNYNLMPAVTFVTDIGVLSKTNVFLDGDIAVDYDVILSGMYDANKTYVKFTVTGANGTDVYEVPGVLVDPSNDTYNYSLGLAPHRMGDTIKPELISDGKVLHSLEAFTIKDYCLNLYNSTLEKSKLTPNQYAAMKNLVIDMLHYGAIAQTFVDYDTENLVNEGLEIKNFDDFQMRPISYEEIEMSKSTKYGTEFTATSLYFDSSNRMCFKFKTDDIDNVIVNIGDGTPGVAAKDMAYTYLEDEDAYVVYTDIIDPADYGKVFTVRLVNINNKGTAYESRTVVQTVKCSVNAYLGTTVAKYQPDMFEDYEAFLYTILAQSAYNYGDSMVKFAAA